MSVGRAGRRLHGRHVRPDRHDDQGVQRPVRHRVLVDRRAGAQRERVHRADQQPRGTRADARVGARGRAGSLRGREGRRGRPRVRADRRPGDRQGDRDVRTADGRLGVERAQRVHAQAGRVAAERARPGRDRRRDGAGARHPGRRPRRDRVRGPTGRVRRGGDRRVRRCRQPGRGDLGAVRPADRAAGAGQGGRARLGVGRGGPGRLGRRSAATDRGGAAEGRRGRHGRHGDLGGAGPDQHRSRLPADGLPGLRVRRPVRRRLHHLQHVRDHRRPTDAGAGAVPSAGCQRTAGDDLGHGRGHGDRRGVLAARRAGRHRDRDPAQGRPQRDRARDPVVGDGDPRPDVRRLDRGRHARHGDRRAGPGAPGRQGGADRGAARGPGPPRSIAAVPPDLGGDGAGARDRAVGVRAVRRARERPPARRLLVWRSRSSASRCSRR